MREAVPEMAQAARDAQRDDRQPALVPPQHATATEDCQELIPRPIRSLRGRVESPTFSGRGSTVDWQGQLQSIPRSLGRLSVKAPAGAG